MNTVRCPSCGQSIQTTFEYCGHCGQKLGRQCPLCQTTNPSQGQFCIKCGAKLSRGEFALPAHLAEEWSSRFGEYDWPRTIQGPIATALNRVTPVFNPTSEILVAYDRVGNKSWFVKIRTGDREIASTLFNPVAGYAVYTNRRLILIDLNKDWNSSYPYESLTGVDLRDNYAGKIPVYRLSFGHKIVELIRKKMTKFPFVLPDTSGVLLTAVVSKNVQGEQAENMVIYQFFTTVLRLRQSSYGV